MRERYTGWKENFLNRKILIYIYFDLNDPYVSTEVSNGLIYPSNWTSTVQKSFGRKRNSHQGAYSGIRY